VIGMAPREFYDLRLNSSNLDGLTTKERISVAISLGYHVQTISHHVSISTLAARDRYVFASTCLLVLCLLFVPLIL
jgi:hypothetical protein